MAKIYHTSAEVEQAFYAAFQDLDISVMQRVWADLPSAYCLHPSGHLVVGYDAVLTSWRDIFRDAQPPQVHHALISESVQLDMVVRLVEERIGPDNVEQDEFAIVLATNVLLNTSNGWRLFSHHASQVRTGITDTSAVRKIH